MDAYISSCIEVHLYKNLALSARVLVSVSPYITFVCRVWEARKCCHGLIQLWNSSVLSVTQHFTCAMTCMLPCLQHSSMSSAFLSHPLQRPLRIPMEDQKFMVLYHFLKALTLEIQEWSWKVSFESISINVAETTRLSPWTTCPKLTLLQKITTVICFFYLL